MKNNKKIVKFLLANLVLGIGWLVIAYIATYLIGGQELYEKEILKIADTKNLIAQIVISVVLACVSTLIVKLFVNAGKKYTEMIEDKNFYKNAFKLGLKVMVYIVVLTTVEFSMLNVLKKYSSENIDVIYCGILNLYLVIYAIYVVAQNTIKDLNKKLEERSENNTNTYELKNIEVMNIHNEFNKTGFGWRAKFFSIGPLFIGILFLIAGFIFFGIYENIEAGLICALGAGISYIGLCITQLQYGSLLKEYIDSKNNK